MLVTEEKAVNMYCCGSKPEGDHCIGSRCMAWQFVLERDPLTLEECQSAGMAVGLAAALKPIIEPRRGRCGLCNQFERGLSL